MLIKGHKRLNGCKVCKRRAVVVASGGNDGLTSWRELQRSPQPQCNTFNSFSGFMFSGLILPQSVHLETKCSVHLTGFSKQMALDNRI